MYNFTKMEAKRLRIISDIGNVLLGTGVAQGLGFLAIVLVNRSLEVSQFATFMLLFSSYQLLCQINEFGIPMAVSKHGSEEAAATGSLNKVYTAASATRAIISLIFVIIIAAGASDFSYLLFSDEKSGRLVIVAALATVPQGLYTFIIAAYQAERRFWAANLVRTSAYGTQFFAILLLLLLGVQEAETFFNTLILAFVPILPLWALLLWRRGTSVSLIDVTALAKTALWIFAGSVVVMILMRLDIFMLNKFAKPEDVSMYAAAMQLGLLFPLVGSSLTGALFPNLHDIISRSGFKGYIRNILKHSWIAVVFGTISALVAGPIIALVYGERYASAVSVFQILCAAYTMGIIAAPLSLVFYRTNKVRLLVILNIIQLVAAVAGNLVFIPMAGAYGAAISALIVRAIAIVYLVAIGMRLASRYDHPE